MNIGEQGVEQERSVQELNYGNVHQDANTTTEPTVPYKQSAPLEDAVTRTSDTRIIDVGPSATDITMRTRNG